MSLRPTLRRRRPGPAEPLGGTRPRAAPDRARCLPDRGVVHPVSPSDLNHLTVAVPRLHSKRSRSGCPSSRLPKSAWSVVL